MKDFTLKHNYFLIAVFLLGTILSVGLITPYLEAEYYSNSKENLIDGQAICDKHDDSKLRYFKITKYDISYRSAIIYCFYENSDYNSQLELEYQNTRWLTLYTYKLNKKGNFYWPFYI